MTTSPETTPALTDEVTEESSSRRHALRALLAGGGAAVGAVAFGKSASAGTEGAPNPDNTLELGAGETNESVTPTTLVHTPALPRVDGPSSLSVAGGVPSDEAPFSAQVGGYGNNLVVHGLHGSTSNPNGFGAVAANLADGPDESGEEPSAPPTALALASVAGSHLRFVALGSEVVGPPAGTHIAGDLYRDAEGTLWFTVPAPTEAEPLAVRYVKLAGTPAAGSFHAINPQRAYDSRVDAYDESGLLAPNTNRVISVANGHDGAGSVIAENAVPMGATAVQINLTVANPTAENFLAVTDGTTTTTETSVINWGADELQIANSITIPVNAAREIRVYCGDQTGSTQFIVDVFGYYL